MRKKTGGMCGYRTMVSALNQSATPGRAGADLNFPVLWSVIMTTSEKKDIAEKAGAEKAEIPEQNLSDDSLEGVTGGCNNHNEELRRQSSRSDDKWGEPRRK
jgi:hypothetical protein